MLFTPGAVYLPILCPERENLPPFHGGRYFLRHIGLDDSPVTAKAFFGSGPPRPPKGAFALPFSGSLTLRSLLVFSGYLQRLSPPFFPLLADFL